MKCETCIHNPVCIRIVHTFGCTEKCSYYLEEPKQGEWIEVTHSGKDIYLCSECAEAYKMYIPYNFCPNCGARMKEGDEK